MRRFAASIALFVVGGCLDPVEYPCESLTQCAVDGKDGTCHSDGWCVYPDMGCPSGLRYGPAAGDGLAEECAAIDTQGGSVGATSSGTTSLGEGDSTGACGSCIAPPGPCFADNGVCNGNACEYEPLAEGMPCLDDDPCTMGETCDGDGECVPAETIVCDDPPAIDSLCYANPGTCDADGNCMYDPLPVGDDCEDGNACTLDDKCDGRGLCVPGEICQSDDGCNMGICMAGQCMLTPMPDGTSCGGNPADRCCAGTCVDISTDMSNCGGCGYMCMSDEICESVADTACAPNPANTTGRCTCNGENTDCPNGQVCRTLAPVANRCAPEDMADCPGGMFVNVDNCPNYCEAL